MDISQKLVIVTLSNGTSNVTKIVALESSLYTALESGSGKGPQLRAQLFQEHLGTENGFIHIHNDLNPGHATPLWVLVCPSVSEHQNDVHRFDNKIPPRQLKTPVESLVCVVKEKGATKIIDTGPVRSSQSDSSLIRKAPEEIKCPIVSTVRKKSSTNVEQQELDFHHHHYETTTAFESKCDGKYSLDISLEKIANTSFCDLLPEINLETINPPHRSWTSMTKPWYLLHYIYKSPLQYDIIRALLKYQLNTKWMFEIGISSPLTFISPHFLECDCAKRSLPAGWDVRIDVKTGKKIYINHIKRISQWDHP